MSSEEWLEWVASTVRGNESIDGLKGTQRMMLGVMDSAMDGKWTIGGTWETSATAKGVDVVSTVSFRLFHRHGDEDGDFKHVRWSMERCRQAYAAQSQTVDPNEGWSERPLSPTPALPDTLSFRTPSADPVAPRRACNEAQQTLTSSALTLGSRNNTKKRR